jgi:alkylated DNA repair dioxygenase AlkB
VTCEAEIVRAGGLFEPDLPEGFSYREGFISPAEESQLIENIQQIAFANFEMRGVVARRRVAFFGHSYDESFGPARPIPAFLIDLRARAAAWARVDAAAFVMVLINEYRPGAPIGWHRDAPQYGIVAGVSLLSACRMKFRPYVSPSLPRTSGTAPRKTSHEITLQPRSGYLITGAARQQFEHSIPAVPALRYSITFRTLRR